MTSETHEKVYKLTMMRKYITKDAKMHILYRFLEIVTASYIIQCLANRLSVSMLSSSSSLRYTCRV